MRGTCRLTTILAVSLLGLTACGAGQPGRPTPVDRGPALSTTPAGPSGSAVGGLPAPDHVLVVVFENKGAEQVLGSPQAPYLTSLARQGVTFSDAHGVTHPSEPNYLALFSGSPQGVEDDSCPHTFPGPDLGSQLIAAGRTFVGYSEGLPAPGYTGCSSGRYARKHNPWVNFADLPASVNQPATAFPADLAALPTVAFLIPDLCNDMHDCSVRTGDDWARAHLAGYVAWAKDHNSLLAVTFDEDEGTSGNRIATFLVGPMVRAGTSAQRIDHYSVLRTLEEMYGLEPLGRAASAAPITGVWVR